MYDINYCNRRNCTGEMRPSKALVPTPKFGAQDFPGTDNRGQTFTMNGKPIYTDCLKCDVCGYSITTPTPVREGFGAASADGYYAYLGVPNRHDVQTPVSGPYTTWKEMKADNPEINFEPTFAKCEFCGGPTPCTRED